MKRALPLILAIAAFAALSILWIITDRRAAKRIYDTYSSANTSENGSSLAFGYLGKQRKVEMLTRPIARAQLERNAVVFRLADAAPIVFDPEDLADEKQFGPPKPKHAQLLNDAEETFVRGGGRMIVAVTQGIFDADEIQDKTARKVFPIWPRIADFELGDNAGGYLSLRPNMHALFTSGKLVVLARERIGAGELFMLSTPEVLQNDSLSSRNHLELLSALAGSGRPVYFDEVLHGIVSGEGAIALMKEWNLGPFLLLLALTAILIFWRAGKRVGPAEEDFRDTRSDAVDLVRSLGALYRGVTTETDALALYHDALTRTVANQSGLRGDALRKRVDDLTGGKRDLNSINEGFAKLQAHRR